MPERRPSRPRKPAPAPARKPEPPAQVAVTRGKDPAPTTSRALGQGAAGASSTARSRSAKMTAKGRVRAAGYHHGDLRNAIVAASLEQIAASGVQGLSLREVARRAGVSPAAPYHHFHSREALLAEVAREGFVGLWQAQRAAVDAASPDPGAQLRASGCAYVDFAVSHPAHYQVMFHSTAYARTPDLEAVSRPTFELLFEQIIACQRAGVAPADVEVGALVILLWSIVHGVASLRIDGPLADGLTPAQGRPIAPASLGPTAVDLVSVLLETAAALRKRSPPAPTRHVTGPEARGRRRATPRDP